VRAAPCPLSFAQLEQHNRLTTNPSPYGEPSYYCCPVLCAPNRRKYTVCAFFAVTLVLLLIILASVASPTAPRSLCIVLKGHTRVLSVCSQSKSTDTSLVHGQFQRYHGFQRVHIENGHQNKRGCTDALIFRSHQFTTSVQLTNTLSASKDKQIVEVTNVTIR
jgi:hypothetical protein